MAQLGRPREFDIDEALDDAMDAFWANGYEATSMADLIDATGLPKGSIYKAFGDKRSLFRRALERYLQRNIDDLQDAVRDAPDAITGLERAVKGMVLSLGARRNQRRGCFAVNSVVEFGPHDPEVAARLRTHFKRQRDIIEPLIAHGQERGEIRDDESAGALTDMLLALVPGLVVASKLGSEQGGPTMDLVLRGLRP